MIRKLNPKKLGLYPKCEKPFNKENLKKWIFENWTLFEEENGEINPDIFEASFNAFGKKQSLYGKKSIEEDQWINEIFNELDEIRKSEKYFDLRKGRINPKLSKKKVSKKKSSKKLTKKVKKVTKKKSKRIVRTGRTGRNWDDMKQNAAGGFGAGFGIGAGSSFANWLFD